MKVAALSDQLYPTTCAHVFIVWIAGVAITFLSNQICPAAVRSD